VVVTDGLKTQEGFQQDVETWSGFADLSKVQKPKAKIRGLGPKVEEPAALQAPLFYPSWEILPHEAKLPHADVISERLETLVALSKRDGERAPVIVTNVAALLQRTFTRAELQQRMRTVKRGDELDPLDLVEWLEDQGYEPEAQVN